MLPNLNLMNLAALRNYGGGFDGPEMWGGNRPIATPRPPMSGPPMASPIEPYPVSPIQPIGNPIQAGGGEPMPLPNPGTPAYPVAPGGGGMPDFDAFPRPVGPEPARFAGMDFGGGMNFAGLQNLLALRNMGQSQMRYPMGGMY